MVFNRAFSRETGWRKPIFYYLQWNTDQHGDLLIHTGESIYDINLGGSKMSVRTMVFSLLLFLVLLPISALAASKQDLTIYQALQIAEKAEIHQITSAVKAKDFWMIKGSNMNNTKPAEIMINVKTGLVTSAKNITPNAIILGENTYGFSGTIYPVSSEFAKSDQIYNGFEIYQNDSRYFQMKHAIFIKTQEGFVAYFMTSGPGMTK